ncbi:MAG: isochorismatase family cysteine hydrolase [Polyangiaceae bacterium]
MSSKDKSNETPEKTALEAPQTAHEVLTAELVAQILSGRPQRLLDMAMAQLPIPPEVARREVVGVSEALATLALIDNPQAPSKGLRDRILKTLSAKLSPRPARRALLVIDMLNDHLTPGRPLEVPRAREIIPALEARIAAARKDKMPIVYVCDQHELNDADFNEWAVHNVRGSKGAEVWPSLAPQAGDLVVHKPTYSSFTRSNLADVLKDLKVDTLVLSGCATELGMLATATDALQRGYAIELPHETQAGMLEQTEQMALMLLSMMPPYAPAREQLLAALSV